LRIETPVASMKAIIVSSLIRVCGANELRMHQEHAPKERTIRQVEPKHTGGVNEKACQKKVQFSKTLSQA
jgi:hypothetical protein